MSDVDDAATSSRLAFACSEWEFPEGVTFLNHGSFGPTPRTVLAVRERLQRAHAANPMNFFLRQLDPLLEQAADEVARFVGGSADQLIFLPNATAGMNIVAANIELAAGDEVLLTDHEYGAVMRLWGQVCQRAGAKAVLARLPLPLDDPQEMMDRLFEQVKPHTKLLVVSHITSPTAIIFPIREICERAQSLGVMVAVDGPHALGVLPLQLRTISYDFYMVSGHKWLCGPFGSGFMSVRSRHKQGLRPTLLSWGRSLVGNAPNWKDEFHWPGTFDPTPHLSLPTAIQLFQNYGLERFRNETHQLCAQARKRLLEIPGTVALTADSPDWYGSMVSIQLPLSDQKSVSVQSHPLQKWLWETHQIEVPVIRWRDRSHLRISCHLYNTEAQYDFLAKAVEEWLSEHGTFS